MTQTANAPKPDGFRGASALIALSSLGELGVGLAVLIHPPLVGLLLGLALDPGGLFAARMAGIAVIALGLTWWLAREDRTGLGHYIPGFLVYNLGVGLLFLSRALTMTEPAFFPWLVAAVHLLVGIALGAIALGQRAK